MISVAKLIDELGYDSSPNFVTGNALGRVPGYGHIFRRAQQPRKEGEKSCGLHGVYTLRQRPTEDLALGEGSLTPVVYVCEAASEADADKIHRLVWNQDVVPFLIVHTPQNVRVYSGFGYREDESARKRPASRILKETIGAQEIASKLIPSFSAQGIDDGTLWRDKGRFVTPDMRVDWRLLDRLKDLGRCLREEMELPAQAAHALIGKYVYLRYLRDRDILSEKRLAEFQIDAQTVFSRKAQLSALRSLVERLDDWLNGSVFEIPWKEGVKAEHVKRVAATFFGDDPRSGQGSLFEDYDFSYIPIETLSVVYEQFLHAEGRGKDAGAYYTPIPLVNFILDEMESSLPFAKGMRVLDPSCGSGAFLVQCYRRLIEKELLKRKGERFRPVELRALLQGHVFGIDRDEDACQVTELSLVLTLLDYVDPPDLSKTNFKLPKLRGANIFGGRANDFFNTNSEFHQKMGETKFDWLVGNPPWIEINDEKPRAEDEPAREWRNANAKKYPTGGNQVAELFAWKATEHLDAGGNVGLLMPAMTLFKDESFAFRQAFFARVKVSAVVNFANLAYVLFAGRSEVPAAAFFYQKRSDGSDAIDEAERILTFAPLVTNQEPNRPTRFNRKVDTWTVTINGSELRDVGVAEAIRGDALTWKLAMWGSYRDRRLLEAVGRRFRSTLGDQKEDRGLIVLEGFQLREATHNEDKDFVQEIVGKDEFVPKRVREVGPIFAFPKDALRAISSDRAYLRTRGGKKPLMVCNPPHIIVQASRNYAIFSERFVVVPPRQIGIAGPKDQADFLKVLSLYLSSDFARYHQYLMAPQWGVSVSVSTLKTLNALPVPLANLHAAEFSEWLDLHARLVAASPTEPPKRTRARIAPASSRQRPLPGMAEAASELPELLHELNDRVYRLLRLTKNERILVDDFVQFKRFAIKGKVSEETAGAPEPDELERYAEVLQAELDGFFEDNPRLRHRVEILYDETSRTGMIDVELLKNSSSALRVKVQPVDDATSANFRRAQESARQKRGQWLYFQRNLRIYEGSRVLLLKPLERLPWLRSQALLDADTIIAETLAGGER
ncbi:MAG: HsdM family class I SAM-dependent methyltransferase [Pirellulales bacterium]